MKDECDVICGGPVGNTGEVLADVSTIFYFIAVLERRGFKKKLWTTPLSYSNFLKRHYVCSIAICSLKCLGPVISSTGFHMGQRDLLGSIQDPRAFTNFEASM